MSIDAEVLRRQLEELPAVERAWVDGPPWQVHLVCGPGAAAQPVEAAAASVLLAGGVEPSAASIRVAHLTPPSPRRRIRLVDASLTAPSAAAATARVTLEWADHSWTGEGEGIGGPGGELRVCVLATLDALRRAVPEMPEVQLVGVRSIRVFDGDLLVVLLRLRSDLGAGLIGSTLRSDDLAASVARAVLNALNRTLANYLAVAD